jgi:hypothetical protein
MSMLRFDVPPVHANVVRLEAFVTFALCLAALVSSFPWLLAVCLAQGFVRGFLAHGRDPLHRLWKRVLGSRGQAGRLENAGAKMFANKVLCFASAVALLLAAAGSPLWRVPSAALAVFSVMEWAFSFCAACWAYGAWYRMRGFS